MRIEYHDLNGQGIKRTNIYDMPSLCPNDFWGSVTNVPCPTNCGGNIVWFEAGYVPGYRICDGCKRHFLARGDSEYPVLLRVGSRRGGL